MKSRYKTFLVIVLIVAFCVIGLYSTYEEEIHQEGGLKKIVPLVLNAELGKKMWFVVEENKNITLTTKKNEKLFFSEMDGMGYKLIEQLGSGYKFIDQSTNIEFSVTRKVYLSRYYCWYWDIDKLINDIRAVAWESLTEESKDRILARNSANQAYGFGIVHLTEDVDKIKLKSEIIVANLDQEAALDNFITDINASVYEVTYDTSGRQDQDPRIVYIDARSMKVIGYLYVTQ